MIEKKGTGSLFECPLEKKEHKGSIHKNKSNTTQQQQAKKIQVIYYLRLSQSHQVIFYSLLSRDS